MSTSTSRSTAVENAGIHPSGVYTEVAGCPGLGTRGGAACHPRGGVESGLPTWWRNLAPSSTGLHECTSAWSSVQVSPCELHQCHFTWPLDGCRRVGREQLGAPARSGMRADPVVAPCSGHLYAFVLARFRAGPCASLATIVGGAPSTSGNVRHDRTPFSSPDVVRRWRGPPLRGLSITGIEEAIP